MNDLNKAKEILKSGSYTCVLCKDDKIYHSEFRGVKPLVSWRVQQTDLHNFSAADKVIGKATAFLYVLHGVCAVYADVISRPALAVLESNGIKAEYENLVDNIINRKGDGICPFEAAVIDVTDPNKAYKKILAQMEEMNISYL